MKNEVKMAITPTAMTPLYSPFKGSRPLNFVFLREPIGAHGRLLDLSLESSCTLQGPYRGE